MSSRIVEQPNGPPGGSLLDQRASELGYTDAWTTTLDGPVSLSDFIVAFWTTPIFRAERLLLTLIGWPSTAHAARALADGASERFAAWRLEARRDDEILLFDASGRTCSWFRVEPVGTTGTRLWFGSGITAIARPQGSTPTIGPGFRALLGAHRVYSRVLLAQARRQLAPR